MKIFIIDKDVNTSFSLRVQLSSRGLKVETLGEDDNSISLIHKLDDAQPDFVVLDLKGFKTDIVDKILNVESINLSNIIIYSRNTLNADDLGIGIALNKNEFDVDELAEKIAKIAANKDK
jgi:DNA-binding response OmpR family regulator